RLNRLLSVLQGRTRPDHPERLQPFYILTVASHVLVREYNPRRPTGVHGHLLVGGIVWEELQDILSTWGYVAPNAIVKITHAWGAIHYALAQHPRPEAPSPMLPPTMSRDQRRAWWNPPSRI